VAEAAGKTPRQVLDRDSDQSAETQHDPARQRKRTNTERIFMLVLALLAAGVALFGSSAYPEASVAWIVAGCFAFLLALGAAIKGLPGQVIRRVLIDFLLFPSAAASVDTITTTILDKWQTEAKAEVAKAEDSDSKLDFATLWRLTQDQMNSYHKIATNQANQSFRLSQWAMIIGLLMIIGFGVAAVMQKDPIAAATAGAISVVSGAVSAYISATFMRAYTEATAQMRQFFVQPADFTRLLGAERLIETISKEKDDHRTEAVKIVLQSMSFASPYTLTEQGTDAKEAAAKTQ